MEKKKASARKRWVCPKCDVGVLAPIRPRKNNVLRYCLPCSQVTGKLVERFCPSLDDARNAKAAKADAKKAAKAEAKKAKADANKLLAATSVVAPKARKPSITKRSWIRDPKYQIPCGQSSFNMMEVFEKMLKSSQWHPAVLEAVEYRRRASGLWVNSFQLRAPISNVVRNNQKLWDRCMKSRGEFSRYSLGIRFTRSATRDAYTSGNGGPSYGVTMQSGTNPNIAGLLMTAVHELVHYNHLSIMREPIVNRVRRPHGYDFNLIQCRMAKSFWGYDFNPYEGGWSLGKGYAPSRHLQEWLSEQIKARNPRVMKWVGGAA